MSTQTPSRASGSPGGVERPRHGAPTRRWSRTATALVAALAAATSSGLSLDARAQGEECFPPCRTGFLCHGGQCVSVCNPPCPHGERCTSDGECEAPPTAQPPPASIFRQPAATARPADPGWANDAGIAGIISSVVVLGLAIGSEATKEDQVPALFPLGVTATLTLAVMGPITAGGASSARGGGEPGAPGLRIAGWTAYGLAMANAAFLIVVGIEEEEPVDGLTATAGLLGATALILLSLDAFESAAQASDQRLSDTGPSWAPALALTPRVGGGVDVIGGVSGAF